MEIFNAYLTEIVETIQDFYRRNGEYAQNDVGLYVRETSYGDLKFWAGPRRNASDDDYLITCLEARRFFSVEFDGCFENGKLTEYGETKIDELITDEYDEQFYEQLVDDYESACEYDKRDEAARVDRLRRAMYNR